jgi:hypothetical protein
VPVSSFSEAQRNELLALIEIYVGNLREGHVRLRMAEVEAHLDETYFASTTSNIRIGIETGSG